MGKHKKKKKGGKKKGKHAKKKKGKKHKHKHKKKKKRFLGFEVRRDSEFNNPSFLLQESFEDPLHPSHTPTLEETLMKQFSKIRQDAKKAHKKKKKKAGKKKKKAGKKKKAHKKKKKAGKKKKAHK